MESTGLSAWAPHLKDPLVLVGFFILLFSGIITTLLKTKALSSLTTSSELLIGRVIRYAFVMGIIVVVLGFGLAFWKDAPRGNSSAPMITQTTTGGQAPAVVTQGKDAAVNIRYGETKDPEQSKQTNNPAQEGKEGVPRLPQGAVQQKTEGTQSPAVVSGGNVNINFEGKKK